MVALHYLVRNALHLRADFVESPAHKTFDRINRVFRIGDRLALCDLTYQAFASFRNGHHGRSRARTFLVGDNNRFASLHDGYDRIGGPQVNSDNLAHLQSP